MSFHGYNQSQLNRATIPVRGAEVAHHYSALHHNSAAHHAPKQQYQMNVEAPFHKGTASVSHPGDKDFTTKYGDLDFHRDGHREKGRHNPYTTGH